MRHSTQVIEGMSHTPTAQSPSLVHPVATVVAQRPSARQTSGEGQSAGSTHSTQRPAAASQTRPGHSRLVVHVRVGSQRPRRQASPAAHSASVEHSPQTPVARSQMSPSALQSRSESQGPRSTSMGDAASSEECESPHPAATKRRARQPQRMQFMETSQGLSQVRRPVNRPGRLRSGARRRVCRPQARPPPRPGSHDTRHWHTERCLTLSCVCSPRWTTGLSRPHPPRTAACMRRPPKTTTLRERPRGARDIRPWSGSADAQGAPTQGAPGDREAARGWLCALAPRTRARNPRRSSHEKRGQADGRWLGTAERAGGRLTRSDCIATRRLPPAYKETEQRKHTRRGLPSLSLTLSPRHQRQFGKGSFGSSHCAGAMGGQHSGPVVKKKGGHTGHCARQSHDIVRPVSGSV